MKRGEIYFANLNPTVGAEIKKTRPVLVISNDANNIASDLVTIIPITSNTKKVFPFEVLLEIKDSGLKKKSKVQCHQIRTISRLRIGKNVVGIIDEPIIGKIENAIRLHLGLF